MACNCAGLNLLRSTRASSFVEELDFLFVEVSFPLLDTVAFFLVVEAVGMVVALVGVALEEAERVERCMTGKRSK